MKIKHCVNCGKAPIRDYQKETIDAIEGGEFDFDEFYSYLIDKGEEERLPRGKEWERFDTKKAVFPEWPSTNVKVISETRLYGDVKVRFVWDGESYREWPSCNGHFCTNRCAMEFATKLADQLERDQEKEKAFAVGAIRALKESRK